MQEGKKFRLASSPSVFQTLGFGCNRFVSMFVFGVLSRFIADPVYYPEYLSLSAASVLTGIGFLVILGVLAGRKTILSDKRSFVFACALCTLIGLSIILFVAWSDLPKNELLVPYFAGAIPLSIGSAGLFFCWGMVFTRTGGKIVFLEFGAGFILGLGLIVICNILPQDAQPIALLVVCCFDGAFLLKVLPGTLGESSQPSMEPKDARWISKKMFSSMVFCGVAMGMTSALLSHTGHAVYLEESIVRFIVSIIMLGIVGVIVMKVKQEALFAVYRLAFIIIALNTVALLLLPESNSLLLSILFIGHLLFTGLFMFLLFSVAHRMAVGKDRLVGFGVAAFLFGDLVVRYIYGLLEFTGLLPSETLSTIYSIILVGFIIITYVVLFSERDMKRIVKLIEAAESDKVSQSSPLTDNITRFVARAVQDYGLTARESEVLTLLLMGRSSPRIESELYVSESTVRTHIRHIYGKMGIHTRQELIDAYMRFSENGEMGE